MFVQLSPLSLRLFSSVVSGCFSCVCRMTTREGTHLVGKDSLSLCPFDTVLSGAMSRNPLFLLSQHLKFKSVCSNYIQRGLNQLNHLNKMHLGRCMLEKGFKMKSIFSRPLGTVTNLVLPSSL